MCAIQIAKDSSTDKATEGIGQRAAGIEPSDAMAQLIVLAWPLLSITLNIRDRLTSCLVYQLDL